MAKKKVKQLAACGAMVGLFATVLISCASFKPGAEVGRYYFDHNGSEYSITLLESGEVEFKVGNETLTGKYTLEGDVMKLKLSDKSEITISYKDEEMSFKYDDIDMTFVRDEDYTISFDSQGGSKLDSITVKNGRLAKEPKAPVRENYAFVGWYKDEALTKQFDFSKEEITKNIKLYAKWSYVDIVNTLTYTPAGQTEAVEAKVTEGQPYELELPKLEEGYLFDGWFTEDNVRLTDNLAKSIKPWDPALGDINIVAHTTLAFNFEELSDGTLKVSGSEATKNLSEFAIPNEFGGKLVTEIGEFKDHRKLELVIIPSTAKVISEIAFMESPLLETIQVENTKNIENPVFLSMDGILFSDNGATLVMYPIAKKGLEYDVPNYVTKIAPRAFAGVMLRNRNDVREFYGELQRVNLPANIQEIGAYAFYQRVTLDTVTFDGDGKLPLRIGDYAFSVVPLKNFTIPKNTVEIGAGAFATEITNEEYMPTFNERLVLPEGLRVIGANAFETNKGMLSVTLPASVESIGIGAFTKCYNLEEIVFTEGIKLKEIPDSMLMGTALMDIKLPVGITRIGDSAFENSNLQTITIPEGVESIGNRVFVDNKELASVYLPESLKSIGEDLFANCEVLLTEDIHFAENNTIVKIENGVIYSYDMKSLILYPRAKKDAEYIMPNTVERIPDRAFQGNKNIKTITLSTSLKVLPAWAFYQTAFTSIVIPASVEEIGDSVFRTSKITSLTFAENSSLKRIGKEAFNGLNVENLVLPEGLEYISEKAFYMCKATTITLPSTVKAIGNNAFENCSKLASISVNEGGEYKSVDGVLYTSDMRVLVNYPIKHEGTSYTLPATVEELAPVAFYKTSLAEVITTPALKLIGEKAFYNSKVKTIDLANVTQIDGRAFYNASSLESINIESLELMGNEAFYGCKALVELKLNNKLTELSKGAFQNTGITSLIVPGNIKVIGEYAFSGTPVAEVKIEEGVEIIMNNAFSATDKLTSITLPNSLIEIGDNAFDNTSKKKSSLKTITIPMNVERIGDNVFGFNVLDEINVAEENEYFKSIDGNLYTKDGKELLRYASGKAMASFEVPSSVLVIRDYAFNNVPALEEVVIKGNIQRIGFRVFTYNYKLKSITIEASTAYKSVDGVLFSADGKTLVQYPYAKADLSYTIPEGVEVLSDDAFYNDFGFGSLLVTELTLPASLKVRGKNAFAGNSQLKTMAINSQEMVDQLQMDAYDPVSPLNYLTTIKLKEGLAPSSDMSGFKKTSTENGYDIYKG